MRFKKPNKLSLSWSQSLKILDLNSFWRPGSNNKGHPIRNLKVNPQVLKLGINFLGFLKWLITFISEAKVLTVNLWSFILSFFLREISFQASELHSFLKLRLALKERKKGWNFEKISFARRTFEYIFPCVFVYINFCLNPKVLLALV